MMDKSEALKWCAIHISEWGRDMPTPEGWAKAGVVEPHWIVNGDPEHTYITKDTAINKGEWKAARAKYEELLAVINDVPQHVNLDQAAIKLQEGMALVWNGEGLPPVGCKCLVIGKKGDDEYHECEIILHRDLVGDDSGERFEVAVFCIKDYDGLPHYYSHCTARYFRPLESGRDKAEEAVRNAIFSCPVGGYDGGASLVIDALDAGKIPGYGKIEE